MVANLLVVALERREVAIPITCAVYILLEAAASYFFKRFREPARLRFYADQLDQLQIEKRIENLNFANTSIEKRTYRYAFLSLSCSVAFVFGGLVSLVCAFLTYW